MWARSVSTFYNLEVVNTFVHRAGQAPLSIDMDVMHNHADWMPQRDSVRDRLLHPELLSRASTFVTGAMNTYNRAYSPSINTTLTSTRFFLLKDLSVFIPHRLHVDEPFKAPLLQRLSIRSDAGDMASCPISARVLTTMFNDACYLSSVSLRRCVDTTRRSVNYTRRSLQYLSLGSFDESLVDVMSRQFQVEDESHVLIELYGVRDLSIALDSLTTAFGARGSSIDSVEIRYDNDFAASEDRSSPAYSDEFFAFRASFQSGLQIILRYDIARPTWTWEALAHLLPCENARHLGITKGRCSDPREPPADLAQFVAGMHKVHSLLATDREYFDIVTKLPADNPLAVVTFHFRAMEFEDLVFLWHWVRSRRASHPFHLHLKGSAIEGDPDDYRYDTWFMEAPTLAALGTVCVLHDEREFKSSHSVRVYRK
ncbi:unnamed protein product [Peniophora sp. CBMAI 1063]|nr:unnamed protein product [Peniophora sp. CBMAI 1063]